MLSTPNFSVLLAGYLVVYHGNFDLFLKDGIAKFYLKSWAAAGVGNWKVWSFIAVFSIWGLLSQVILGGSDYTGPVTKTGHVPRYRNSGFRYFLCSSAIIAFTMAFSTFKAFSWYEEIPALAGALNLYGLSICVCLYVKGRVHPSPGEYGGVGNFIFDFYWGIELYPRVLWNKIDIKVATNCRFGMMMWPLVVWICWKAQVEQSGWNWAMATSAILQTVYVAKFFWWEDGYMRTIDIMVDRAGYYICWGCIVFVPIFYTSTSIYLTEHSPQLPWWGAVTILVFGIAMIILNYWTDYQRQLVRETHGKCTIWGKPPELVLAEYTDEKGDQKKSILLASGFWGMSRHVNYFFEMLAAFSWELPSLFHSVIPYMYVIFLSILLLHRSHRDEIKCQKKYGRYWNEYVNISRWRILPFVY